ncbi:MAG: D-glycero-beta-D-manno-heptose-1,7-bisphosphate 7-phosphatase [Dehalococcoidia bacterium]|nr:D-glycero-beta-D-manno-heptose-1,7-bisphosphate 7-phosphatase [Dehalococcoidia bacterium]
MAVVRTLFLDRDGVINRNRGRYVLTWDNFEFLPGVLTALRQLREARVQVAVVTNQSPVGRGLVRREELDILHARMKASVVAAGGEISGVFYCPHHPSDGCDCRKPLPGLLKQAASTLGIDLGTAHLIGDHGRDISAARAAGVPATLVLTGHGLATFLKGDAPPSQLAVDLPHAVDDLLQPVAGERRRAAYWTGAARATVRQSLGLLTRVRLPADRATDRG